MVSKLLIIDSHTHVVPPWIKEKRSDYVKQDACFALLYFRPDIKLATTEELINSMDEAEINFSIITNLGWTSHELCLKTNDYILESIACYPKRLIGFGNIQPLAGDKALAEIERCAHAGIRGFGEIRPDVQGFSLENDEIMSPLIETMVKQDLILLLHTSEPVGHQYSGKGNITPQVLYPFILKFPELKLICAHWGGGLPFYALMPEVNTALKNVFFDTSATSFLYHPRIFNHILDIIGKEKILFGSDYPLITQRRAVKEIQSLELPEDIKADILGRNAQRLLSLKESKDEKLGE